MALTSYPDPKLIEGLQAAADYSSSGGQYKFGKLNATEKQVVACVADERPHGVIQNKPKSGAIVEFAGPGGGARITAGGTLSKGDFLKPDANGDAVAAAAGEVTGAFALEDAVDNDVFSCFVIPPVQNPIVLVPTILTDISTAGSAWVACPVAGIIKKVQTIIDGAIATADAALTMEVNGTAVDGLAITVANSGSAAGDVDTDTPTSGNATAVVAAGDKLEIITDGASTNTVRVVVLIHIQPFVG